MAEATDELQEKTSPNGSDGSPAVSGLSKSKLVPALVTAAAAAAAGIAVQKGPELLKKLSGEAEDEAEGLGEKSAQGLKKGLSSGGGAAGKLASKLVGGGGRGGGGLMGDKTRRLPIQRWTDVAVPVDRAYRAWTDFEEFPKFMHRVLEVKKEDQKQVHWREKIWFSTREWNGEIVERRRNDRIAWKSVGGTQHSGLISFHKLEANLTRVMVTIDFVPSGMIEKMASGMRFVKRAVEADLARFKAYVELGDIKGLEYKAKPAEMEQHRDGDDEEDEGDRQEAESRGAESSADSRERDSQREERENRREERRKALSSSS